MKRTNNYTTYSTVSNTFENRRAKSKQLKPSWLDQKMTLTKCTRHKQFHFKTYGYHVMKKKNDLKNARYHRQESLSLPSSCGTHNEKRSLITCKFKHAQILAICNKLRAKLQQLQECLVDRALRVKANKSKIWKCNTANQDFMLWRNTPAQMKTPKKKHLPTIKNTQ